MKIFQNNKTLDIIKRLDHVDQSGTYLRLGSSRKSNFRVNLEESVRGEGLI